MIVIDSSALIAILQEEPGYLMLEAAIETATRRVISSITLYETGIVLLRRRGEAGLDDVRKLIDAYDMEVVAFERAHADAAGMAYARYGKGIDPAARLNLGDCVSYSLAQLLDAPLLFKGNDFTATDVKSCL